MPTGAALYSAGVQCLFVTTWTIDVVFLQLAAALQTHHSLNAAARYLRFAKPAELEWLMPLCWVGFGAAMLPGCALCQRHGPLRVMAVAALCGAGSALAAAGAASLGAVIAAQIVAGFAWGCMRVSIFASAAERGRSGREGLALGTMFAMFALATLVRIGVVRAGRPKNAALAPLLGWLPMLLRVAGAVVIGVLALRARPQAAPAAA